MKLFVNFSGIHSTSMNFLNSLRNFLEFQWNSLAFQRFSMEMRLYIIIKGRATHPIEHPKYSIFVFLLYTNLFFIPISHLTPNLAGLFHFFGKLLQTVIEKPHFRRFDTKVEARTHLPTKPTTNLINFSFLPTLQTRPVFALIQFPMCKGNSSLTAVTPISGTLVPHIELLPLHIVSVIELNLGRHTYTVCASS